MGTPIIVTNCRELDAALTAAADAPTTIILTEGSYPELDTTSVSLGTRIRVTGTAYIHRATALIEQVSGHAHICHLELGTVQHLTSHASIQTVGSPDISPDVDHMDAHSHIVSSWGCIGVITDQAHVGTQRGPVDVIARQGRISVATCTYVTDMGPNAVIEIADDCRVPDDRTPLADDPAAWCRWAGAVDPDGRVRAYAPTHKDYPHGYGNYPVLTTPTGDPVYHESPHGWAHPDGTLLLPHPDPTGHQRAIVVRPDPTALRVTATGARPYTALTALTVDAPIIPGNWS